MDSTGDDVDGGLERFRSYLLLLARVRLDPLVRASVVEIGERLGRMTAAVTGLLHRGLRKLRQQLHDRG